MSKNKRLQMQKRTNDQIVTQTVGQLVVMDKQEFDAMLSQAYRDGEISGARKTTALTLSLSRLLWLCKSIVSIANYASRVDARESFMLTLAQKEAGRADFGELASEIKKRLDVYNNDLKEKTGASIIQLDPEFVKQVMSLSQIMQTLRSGNPAERNAAWETLCSPETAHFIDELATTQRPLHKPGIKRDPLKERFEQDGLSLLSQGLTHEEALDELKNIPEYENIFAGWEDELKAFSVTMHRAKKRQEQINV